MSRPDDQCEKFYCPSCGESDNDGEIYCSVCYPTPDQCRAEERERWEKALVHLEENDVGIVYRLTDVTTRIRGMLAIRDGALRTPEGDGDE